MSQIDRTMGLVGNVAIKAPVKAASSTNLSLTGEQTIDGVVCATDARVLLMGQTDATENGIWVVDTGSWSRAQDFDGNLDVVTGTIVTVIPGGTTYGGTAWRVSTTGTITIDSSSITFQTASYTDAGSVTFTQAGTGAVSRTVQSRLREMVISVEDFDAVPLSVDPAYDSTVEIGRAITQAAALGGATVFFPKLYRATQITVSSTGITLCGTSRSTSGLWVDTGVAATFVLDVNITPLATQNSFSMRDMGLFGNTTNVTANAARLYSGIQLNNVYTGDIQNVFLQGLDVAMKGKNCYGLNIDNVLFEQYNIGITGGTDPSVSFAENTFREVRFNDGNTVATAGHAVATAIAILDVAAMNSNTFIGCTFAGTSLAQVDMSNSYGGNTFIQCRWERMKAASTWLKLGSYNKLINCAFYTDGAAVWYDAANPTTNWAIDIIGDNNTIDGIGPEYWWNVIRLRSGATNNDVRLAAFGATAWIASLVFICPVNDMGSHNTVRVGTDDYTTDNTYCRTDRACNNFFLRSETQGAVTVSGLTVAYATVGNTNQAAAQGPFNIGHCYKYDTPVGNRRWSQTIANTVVGHYYTFSFYVYSLTADQTAEIIIGNSLADANAYASVELKTGMFQRVFGIFKATAVTIEVGMRLAASSNGVVVTAPNVMDCGTNDNDIIVGAYIPTIDGGSSTIKRALSAAPFDRLESEGQPDTGTWAVGKFVHNLNPVEATQVIAAANVMYVTLGWTKITNGTANVVNTDWLAARALTGN
jgi:uncharacterized cupin superfamily protein